MGRRRGLTLIELAVAMLIASVVLYSASQVLHFVGRSERAGEREASSVITRTRMSETLLMDIRSSIEVSRIGNEAFLIRRHSLIEGEMKEVRVVWRRIGDPVGEQIVIEREPDSGARHTFRWSQGGSRQGAGFEFVVEERQGPSPDLVFQP